jgi:hypothetical protein
MKTVRSKKGPFAELPHFSLSEIERICSTELMNVGLMPPEPQAIRIERFIEKRFGISPSYEDIPSDILGFTEFGRKGVVSIVLSRAFDDASGSVVQERRLRTTLAHEAGHGLLHAHLFALGEKPPSLFDSDAGEPTILCRDVLGESTQQKKYDGRWWEFQANRAMAGLLMPRKLVEIAARKFLKPAGILAIPVLENADRSSAERALADLFEVNPIVARFRLEDLFPSAQNRQPTL